jgi:hypothetical protein
MPADGGDLPRFPLAVASVQPLDIIMKDEMAQLRYEAFGLYETFHSYVLCLIVRV